MNARAPLTALYNNNNNNNNNNIPQTEAYSAQQIQDHSTTLNRDGVHNCCSSMISMEKAVA